MKNGSDNNSMYTEIRREIPLYDYCENNGIPLRSIGNSYRANSPFTDGKNAFSIRKDSPDFWNDYSLTGNAGQLTGKNGEGNTQCQSGDVIDLCAWLHHNGDKREALHDLAGKLPEEKRRRLLPKIDKYIKDRDYEQGMIQRAHEALISGRYSSIIAHWLPYLHSRGVDDAQIRRLELGFDVNRFRLIIPRFNFNGNEILYHKTRRMPNEEGQVNNEEAPYMNAELEGNEFLRNVPLGLQTLNRKDTGKPLVLCEGDFDCMNFENEGFAVLGSGGGCFSAHEWQEFIFPAAEDFDAVVLAFDADKPGQEYTKQAAEKLFTANIPFSVVLLPEGCKDINDYYREALSEGKAGGGLDELVEDAMQGLDYLVMQYIPEHDFDILPRSRKAKLQKDLKDFLIKALRYGCDKPDIIRLCSLLNGRYPSEWLKAVIKEAGQGKTEDEVVEEIRSAHELLYNERTGFFEYSGARGVWEKRDDTEIGAIVRATLGRNATNKKIISLTEHLKRACVSNEPVEKFNRLALFAFANGTLHIRGDVSNRAHLREELFKPSSANDFVTFRRNFDYSPDAKCPEWEKALEAIMLRDKKRIACFQEFCGYCLLNHCDYEKALILRDPNKTGSNGKSTILAVIRAVFGDEGCTSLEPADFADKYSVIMLKDASVNICTDAKPEVGGGLTNLCKAITGKDKLRGRGLYRDYIDFTNKAKIIFAVNGNLKLKDDAHTEPLKRRLLLIDCLAHFVNEPAEGNAYEHKKDFRMTKKLTKELAGIFNWMLNGANRLIRNEGHFTLTDEHVKELEGIFEADTDHVGRFVDEAGFAEKRNVSYTWGEIGGKYTDFCTEAGIEPLMTHKFHSAFIEALKDKGIRYRPKQNKKGINCFEFLGQDYTGFEEFIEEHDDDLL